MPRETGKKQDAMHAVAAAIVRYRFLIIALFLAAAVYCALSMGRVRVNSDLTAFLSPETETRQGLTIMEEEFVTYATQDVMLSNVTFEQAQELADEIAEDEGVSSVSFDDSPARYTGASALLSISYKGVDDEPAVDAAKARVAALLAPYDSYAYSMNLANYSKQLAAEMGGVLLIAVLVIVAILLFTSRSYFEVVIFFIVFVFAALLNMGTNFWLGEISSITHSIAVIMQLALAIDYAIIFAHRYQDEAARCASEREALVEALAKSIVEIASSSLTTISGLVALTLMQFRLGYDLGVVLTKGIVCSMITVFLLMPGLILLFPRAIRKTAHRNLVPDITGWGRFLSRSHFFFVIVFALILPFAIVFSGRTRYAFADGSVDELVYSKSRAAMHKISDTFAPNTAVALLVPAGDYDSEKAILREAAELPEVKSALGLANIPIDGEHMLTDRYNARSFAELLDVDVERSRLLFRAYGVQHEEYQAIFGAQDDYEVPLIDLLLYLFEKIDQGIVNLDGEQTELLEGLRGRLEQAVVQLRGTGYDRMVLTAAVPAEGEESTELVEKVRDIAARYFDRASVLVVGDITSARDLRESYDGDSLLISLLTLIFVYLILLFTFRSPIGAAVLVFVIQGSIWINFSFPYLQDVRCSFVTNMIVSAIQMGATIDHAFVIMSRFQEQQKNHPPREAAALAVGESFPTVLTSGAMMTMAGFLIAFRVSDVYVGHIGLAVGRGALISVILVLTVLPQLLLIFDRLIDKTTFRLQLDPGGEGK